MKTGSLRIRTPEGVEFAFPLAGPVTRFAAWLVDCIAVMVVATGMTMILRLLTLLSADLAQAAVMLSYFVLMFAYSIVLEWRWQGQTLGKHLLHLRVTDERGLKLQLSQVIIRNLMRVVDMLPGPYAVGGISCMISRQGQRLGDIAAGTIVVRQAPFAAPDLRQLETGKFNSLRAHPHLAARLRHVTPAPMAALALQAVVRRDELNPEARLEVFGELAEDFKRAVTFPPESTEAISDEQYVRNVVEVLFHRPAVEPFRGGTATEKNVALESSTPTF